jgi:hypothetical protein
MKLLKIMPNWLCFLFVEKALDPSSPSGIGISTEEKDNIYKAIKEVEARIASLKKAIE